MKIERLPPILKPGQIVYIRTDPRWISLFDAPPQGVQLSLYETIKLDSFPSASDYFGATVLVKPGKPVLVLSLKGRPHRIDFNFTKMGRSIPLGELEIDVYRILVDGQVKEALRAWLSVIPPGD